MSYSFHEVVPFLFYKDEDGEICFHFEAIKNIAGTDIATELEEAFDDLTQNYLIGSQVDFYIPEFTSMTDTGEEITFAAKNFTMNINKIEKFLEQLEESSESYSYLVHMTDVHTGEVFTYYAYYYVNMYHILKEITCYLIK